MPKAPAVLAAVDIGTNSVKLLVANVEPRHRIVPVRQDVVITRIGEGFGRNGRLLPAAMARTRRQLLSFARVARSLGALQVRAVATSVLRDAPNGPEFLADLRRRTGWRVDVISGRREALLGFLGAAHGMGHGRRAVFDVGGGSAQISLGDAAGVDRARSLRLGAVRLTERFFSGHPICDDELARARAHISRSLSGVRPAAEMGTVVGIGGTVACLARLHCVLQGRPSGVEDIQNLRITRTAIERLLHFLAGLSVMERRRLPTMEPGRADVIVAGACTVAGILDALEARSFRVSTHGIRFGLLVEMAAGALGPDHS